MNISNQQWRAIKDVLDDMDDPVTKASVKAALVQLLDKEPYRQAVIELLVQAENLGLEVLSDEETGEIYIQTGMQFLNDGGNYSQIQFLSDDEDSNEDDEDDDTDDV